MVGGGGPEPWFLQPWVPRPDAPTAPVAFCGTPFASMAASLENSAAAWLKVAGHCLGGSEALFRIPPLIPIGHSFSILGWIGGAGSLRVPTVTGIPLLCWGHRGGCPDLLSGLRVSMTFCRGYSQLWFEAVLKRAGHSLVAWPNGVTLQSTHCGLKSSHLYAPFP